jgi:hypothetical protein
MECEEHQQFGNQSLSWIVMKTPSNFQDELLNEVKYILDETP